MNRFIISKLVRKPSGKNHPSFFILHNQKLVYFTKEAGEILGVSNPARPFKQSKAGIDCKTIPVISSKEVNELLASIGNHSSIFYPSAFFLCFLRSNKPSAVFFTRWVLQEAIPTAGERFESRELNKKGLKLMELVDENERKTGRLILVDLEGIEIREPINPTRFENSNESIEEGE